MLIRFKSLMYFMIKCTCYDVALMDVLSFLFIWLYAGYKHVFITDSSYGSYHVLIGK